MKPMFSTLSVLFRPMYGNPDSGILKILACRIRKAGFGIRTSNQEIQNPVNDWTLSWITFNTWANCLVLQDFSLYSRQRFFQLSAQYSHGLLPSFNKDTVRRNQKLATIAALKANYLTNCHLTAVSFDCFYQLRRLFDSLDKILHLAFII